MFRPIQSKKTPSLDEVKKTLSILTCKCTACETELNRLNMGEHEKMIGINYCRNRLAAADDYIRVLTDV